MKPLWLIFQSISSLEKDQFTATMCGNTSKNYICIMVLQKPFWRKCNCCLMFSYYHQTRTTEYCQQHFYFVQCKCLFLKFLCFILYVLKSNKLWFRLEEKKIWLWSINSSVLIVCLWQVKNSSLLHESQSNYTPIHHPNIHTCLFLFYLFHRTLYFLPWLWTYFS